MMQKAQIPVGRGVWVAPWVGPSGELVLLAITRDKKLAGEPYAIPTGANHVEAGDRMWARLDADDPIPNLKVL